MRCFVKYSKYCDFPIENLPYGVFSTENNPTHRIGVAIGDLILDLSQISHLFDGPILKHHQDVFKQHTLNDFMALSNKAWKEARETIQELLSSENETLQNNVSLRARAFCSQKDATMHLPAKIGDYSDFFSSLYHALNCGVIMGGKEHTLFPNWKSLPLGYHGRASSIVVSGTSIHRPYGQSIPTEGAPPMLGTSKLMDFELEMAYFVGHGTKLGQPINIENAQEYIFGYVLMNDWSARDIQKWESVPLGPFTSKNLGTSISPWVVSTFALEPFLVDNVHQDPTPMPYLKHSDKFNFDIQLQVDITPKGSNMSTTVCRSNYKYLYWTAKQLLAQQTITGCNLNPGDLIGSGTISGELSDSLACLLELSWGGTKPISLLDGSQRTFLQDGDTVTMKAFCEGQEYNIGFGTCVGTLLPALEMSY